MIHISFFALGNIFWDLTLTQDLLDSALPLAPNNRFLWHVTICLARRRIALAARLPVVFRYINMIGTPTKRYATVSSRDIGERFQSIPLPEMQMDLYLYSLLKFQQLHNLSYHQSSIWKEYPAMIILTFVDESNFLKYWTMNMSLTYTKSITLFWSCH